MPTRSATIEELRTAHRKVAQLAVADPTYLPIFKRLVAEIVAYEEDADLMAQARKVVNG